MTLWVIRSGPSPWIKLELAWEISVLLHRVLEISLWPLTPYSVIYRWRNWESFLWDTQGVGSRACHGVMYQKSNWTLSVLLARIAFASPRMGYRNCFCNSSKVTFGVSRESHHWPQKQSPYRASLRRAQSQWRAQLSSGDPEIQGGGAEGKPYCPLHGPPEGISPQSSYPQKRPLLGGIITSCSRPSSSILTGLPGCSLSLWFFPHFTGSMVLTI